MSDFRPQAPSAETVFLPIRGVPEYFASRCGQIRTFDRCILSTRIACAGRTLKQRVNASGHCTVNPMTIPKLGLVHRMVMAAFTGNHIDHPCDVHHKDEDKSNNSFDNLVYEDRSDHRRHHALQQMREMANPTGYRWVRRTRGRAGKLGKSFIGQFTFRGKPYWTEVFATAEEASVAVNQLHQEVSNEF
jgi:hypothetical protein